MIDNSPYLETPGTAEGTNNKEIACRVNTHVLLSDGYWNNTGNAPSGFDQDEDSDIGIPTNTEDNYPTEYDADSGHSIFGFNDSNSLGGDRNLADMTFHFWINDLRSDLTNNLSPYFPDTINADGEPVLEDFWNPVNDPATWQHMVNFTVSFGIAGAVAIPSTTQGELDYADLLDGDLEWTTTNTELGKADDLYHAAINSRGEYFSAGDPNELASAFIAISDRLSILKAINAPVIANSGRVSSDSLLYIASFNSESWTGNVSAVTVSDGTQVGVDNPTSTCHAKNLGDICDTVWSADHINNSSTAAIAHSVRNVFTYKDTSTGQTPAGSGINFKWDQLDADQTVFLNSSDGYGEERLNYIRGDDSNEGTLFRVRQEAYEDSTASSRVGPIINSAPVYVGKGVDANGIREFNFPDDLHTPSYSSFISTISTRSEMVYVASNDGMLHGFDASKGGGSETFAYVPNKVIENLYKLTDPDFISGSFVDGPIEVNDAFYGGDWHTLLVGGLRAGGQGYYALDISNPASSAADIVEWEFTDENDADLGFTYGKAQIIRGATTSGGQNQWYAIVSNGYNSTLSDGNASTTGKAALFVLDAATGAVVKKFTVGSTGTNGLASPTAVDTDGDNEVDFVYAGDLNGDMWKFDISSSDTSQWSSTKLFSAGTNQPITSAPAIGSHPQNKGGVVVYFGTGKLLEDSDVTSSTTQAFYAIWDENSSSCSGACVSSSQLLEQTVTSVDSSTRINTDNAMNWTVYKGWTLALTQSSSLVAERVTGRPTVNRGIVQFSTLLPTNDVCSGGATGVDFVIDRNNGGTFHLQIIDTNGDGVIDVLDQIDENTVNNISQSFEASSGEGVLFSGDQQDVWMSSTGSGVRTGVQAKPGKVGRIRWRELGN